jgi:hypothetical protein
MAADKSDQAPLMKRATDATDDPPKLKGRDGAGGSSLTGLSTTAKFCPENVASYEKYVPEGVDPTEYINSELRPLGTPSYRGTAKAFLRSEIVA